MKIITILFASILLSSCIGNDSKTKGASTDLNEGKLTYSVSGEGTTPSWEFDVLFNKDNAIIVEKYDRGAGKKYIFDKKSNEILGLIDADAGEAKTDGHFLYFTPEELVDQEFSAYSGDAKVTKTDEFKDILGYNCQKTIIEYGNQVSVEAWLTDKIKPGILYSQTPLAFDEIALEYEVKIDGNVDRKYVVKSISDEKIDEKEFEHVVPDSYYLVVPAYLFSSDDDGQKDFEENTYKSFTYPYFKDGRQSTVKFIKDELSTVFPKDDTSSLSTEFFVNKDGSTSDVDVKINNETTDKRIEKIKEFIQAMNGWTPAKVKGVAVKSKVTIFE